MHKEKKTDMMVKIQNHLSTEIRKSKNIIYLFECLCHSLPYVQRVEQWIRQSTLCPANRRFSEVIQTFPTQNVDNETVTRMNPGDVVLVPRSAAHVRIFFLSKYAFDLKFAHGLIVLEGDNFFQIFEIFEIFKFSF